MTVRNECSGLAIDHVAIAVENLDEAIEWYTENLGFEIVERRRTQGERTAMISAVLKLGPVIVVLIEGVDPDSQVSRFIQRFGPGVQHLAIQVPDLDKAIGGLKTATADVDIIEEPGIRQVFLRRDPGSGVRVELIERRGGNFSDRSVERLFRALEEKDLV
ncbi:VOC family protein [Methylocystis sp.]|uniref:VOC family protein n=1 Tax=Methylocystis sp. TaxID=1911079 RepID=UPI0025F0CF45|nr:VOC family protein [Methylocystis sp.]